MTGLSFIRAPGRRTRPLRRGLSHAREKGVKDPELIAFQGCAEASVARMRSRGQVRGHLNGLGPGIAGPPLTPPWRMLFLSDRRSLSKLGLGLKQQPTKCNAGLSPTGNL
jgi:hypothetical protein